MKNSIIAMCLIAACIILLACNNDGARDEYKADVDLYIPIFKIEYEIKLVETLQQLRMGIAFTDFSDIPLCISNVKQKTFFLLIL